MQSFDRDLLILLNDVARLMRTRFDRRARAQGMTRAQWFILARLSHHPGQSQNELAAVCEVEPITVGRLIDRLEARGLVERRPDPMDRRIRRLHLLPARTTFCSMKLHAIARNWQTRYSMAYRSLRANC